METETYKVFNKYRNFEELKMIKQIIYYCKQCNYEISFSTYDNLQQIIDDANIIRFYGNEPSVRRAIKLLNKDVKIKDEIKVVMSKECRQRLDEINYLKQENTIKFKVHRGPIKVEFK